jgi:hypothetical protein
VKTKTATREIKEKLSAHFRKGGTLETLPEGLRGFPTEVYEKAIAFAASKRRVKLQNHDYANGVYD